MSGWFQYLFISIYLVSGIEYLVSDVRRRELCIGMNRFLSNLPVSCVFSCGLCCGEVREFEVRMRGVVCVFEDIEICLFV